MSAQWKKGLHPATPETNRPGQCQGCGTCCAFISIPPFREDELDTLPADVLQVIDWHTRNDAARPKSPVPCYFYGITDRVCLIHEHKPQACRDFEPGGPACRKQRSDLLAILNNNENATRQWARHYTRVVVPGGRIQEIAEFSLEDQIMEGMLRDS